jgi:hypothetical protein
MAAMARCTKPDAVTPEGARANKNPEPLAVGFACMHRFRSNTTTTAMLSARLATLARQGAALPLSTGRQSCICIISHTHVLWKQAPAYPETHGEM